jgi:ribosomal protein L37AE/L43A
VTQPIFLDAANHPLPADYDPNAIEQCDDCGQDLPAHELTDTIAGWLCAGCNARFTGAARGLIESSARFAKLKAGKA